MTGCLRETAETSERFVRNGVHVVRVPSLAFDRAVLGLRAANYVSFMLSSFAAGLRVPKPDIVLCMTDPPLLANVALVVARRFRAPLVIVTQDVFPEIAVQLRRLEQPLVVGALREAIGFSLRRADAIVAIGETMRGRLESKGAPPERIVVIPNWADTGSVMPVARHNEWGCRHGLDDRFVVMHSGNVGYAQDLDTLIRASTFLRDLEALSVVVIGAGARREALGDLAERMEADAVRFLPYQPDGVLPQSLSAADVHFVGLAAGLAGYAVPSRLYGVMAAGRPVIVSADADSETARLVTEVGCGLVVPPNRADLVAGAIREVAGGSHDLAEMGRNAHRYIVEEGNREVGAGRYRRLLAELAARG